jgi:hypothetical protein
MGDRASLELSCYTMRSEPYVRTPLKATGDIASVRLKEFPKWKKPQRPLSRLGLLHLIG